MYYLVLFLFIFLGIGTFIFIDLYRAGLRNFNQFDWTRYWNTNQMRIVIIIISAFLLLGVLYLLKDWMEMMISQIVAILGGAASGLGAKVSSKNKTIVSKPSILSILRKEIGVKEIPGPSSNPRILKYAKDLGYDWYKNDDTAWCALATGWAIWKSGREHSGSLMAKSYLNWGQPATAEDIPTGNVIAVFHRGRAGASTGHVGVVESETATTINLLGGNQSNSINVAPFKKNKNFLGYRKPLDA